MTAVVRSVLIALCVVGLATLVGTSAGCGASKEADTSQQWERVLSSEVSGAKPVKLHLGTFPLGTRVRLAWDLTGPQDPPVTLTLRVVEISRGTGFGASLSPGDSLFAPKSEEAIVLGPIRPGDYRIYFSQRFRPSQGPGYDVKFTVYTLR